NADGIGLAVSGTKAYVGRANTAESEFIVVDVSNTAAPFTLAELDMSANLNDLATYGTYVYGASGVQLAEIQIIDVSSSTNPFVVNTIDLAGNGDAQSVVVSGTRMYVTRESHGANPTFYVFDLATSSTAPTILGSLNLGSGAEDVALADSSSYAYIASHHDAQEFQVVNTVNPASMLVGGYWDELNDKDNFQGVAVSGTIAYAGSLTRITAGEFFVMNIANPLSPTNLSSLEIGAHVYSVRVPEDKGAVIIGSASSTAELMLIDASDPVNPVIIDKKDHAGEINDLVIVGDHVYTVTGYDALEFRVFQIE
ncbi:hypothetical protein KJ937_02510, partial [Patescibacteria group bacterium]|nr:hypothetical protein [Patescibacteria group bacterium]